MFENLRKLRKDKKISAKEMQKLLGLKTVAAYYKKESGKIKFSLNEARKISLKFKLPIESIFFAEQVSEMET